MTRFPLCLAATTCLSALAVVAGSAFGQLPHTQLNTVFPAGGKFGATVEVRVSGGDQDEADTLFFSHPGIQARTKMTGGSEIQPARPQAGQFTVEIAGDVPPGVYEARLVGRYGVSNPRAFVVGVYDEALDPGGNNQPQKAIALALDATVNGYVDNNSRDYFKLSLAEGQRVLIDCLAQRIDSRMNAVLVLFDASGKELARSHDYYGEDPFLDFTAPRQGDYVLALYDGVYAGGAEHFYRLTTHLGPHLDLVFPPAGLAGSSAEYTLYGRNLPEGRVSELTLDGVALEKLTVNIPLPGGDNTRQLSLESFVPSQSAVLDSFDYRLNTSNPVTIYYAQAPVVGETEANDQPGAAQSVTAPCEVAGRFYPARDIDWTAFEARKGQVFHIDVYSQRLGLDTDPRIIVQKVTRNDQGEENVQDLVNVDDPGDRNSRIGGDFDTSTDDPSYRLTADQDAVYRVCVFDQFGDARSDPRSIYRLVIREAAPDFRLVAVPQPLETPANANVVLMGSACVRKGGTTAFTVRAERQDGFAGEIEVTAEGLPEGLSTRGALIGAGDSTTTLVFEAQEDAPHWAGAIRILGKARQGDQELVRVARGGAVVWGTGNRTQQPPAFRATRDVALAIMHEASPAWVEVGESKVWETSRGGKLEIPIRVVRRRDFNGDLKLVANGLPKELKPGDLNVKGDAGEAKLEVNATNKDAKPGVYTFFLRADTKAKFARNPDAVPAAEQEQKRLDELVKQLSAAAQQAEQAKTAAVAAAEKAAEALQQAEQAKNKAAEAAAAEGAGDEATEALEAAEQALADARTQSQAAAEAKTKAEQEATDAAALAKQAQDAKAAADKQLEDVKKANAPKDFNFLTLSTPVRLRIVETPLKLTVTAPEAGLQQGGQAEIPVRLERLFGFADKVDVSVELPKDVAGLEAAALALEKETTEGKLQITAKDNAPPGDHTLTIRAKAKFNNIDVEASQQIVLKVEAKAS